MKRAGFFLIFLAIIMSGHARTPINSNTAEELISRMTLEEKLSQLMIIRAFAGGTESHLSILERQLKKYPFAGIMYENGTPDEINRVHQRFSQLSSYNLLSGTSINWDDFGFPSEEVLLSISDHQLLEKTGFFLSEQLQEMKIDFVMDPMFQLETPKFRQLGRWISRSIFVEGVIPIHESGDYIGMEEFFGGLTIEQSDPITSRRKIDYAETLAGQWRSTGFEDLIFARADHAQSMLTEGERILHLLNSGADLILFPSDIENSIQFLVKAVRTGKLSKKTINQKLRRIYTFGNPLKSNMKDSRKLSEKKLLIEQLYQQSITLAKDENCLVPFRILDTLNIAVSNDNLKGPEFHQSLKKYTSIFEINLKEGLIKGLDNYDILIVSLSETTSHEEWEIAEKINHKMRVLAVAFGNIPLQKLGAFEHVVKVPVENEITRSYVAQQLFGSEKFIGVLSESAIPSGFSRGIETHHIGRLGYSSPEKVRMDPLTLLKIDEIAEEAITKEATPGIQVLVARSGKVVYQKSYGHYTYNNQVDVSNETIYDLASVTKVAATLQAISFLYDQGRLDINRKVSDYLIELKGSNKENLLIKDVLLHQAGLRPWIPFWRETMSSDEINPDYYSLNPEESYPLQVSSGLYAREAIRDSVWQWIIDSRLMRKKTDEPYSYRYSDIGFYMMQQLAERLLNQSIDEFMRQNFYDPLGMSTTTYLPLCKFDGEQIAPTSKDRYFRKQMIQGIVHDEGAAMFGGVAGHSGLFSNANDLAKLMQMLLQKGYYGGQRYFNSKTIELFTSKQVIDNRRGLGWDKPNMERRKEAPEISISAHAFGHTGFTGTAVWADPEYDLVYIFLSNRIHPDPENTKLMSLGIRDRIHEVIYESIANFELLDGI